MKKVVIDKKDLENNIKIIKTMKNKKTKIIGVVKANGMGLDLVKYSKFLTYKGISIILPPQPGITPSKAPIIGCSFLFFSKIFTIFPPVL